MDGASPAHLVRDYLPMASEDHWQLMDEVWLRRHYVDMKLRMVDLEEMIGCTNGELRTQLHRFGIRKQADVSVLTRELLQREHVESRRSPRSIGQELGCSEGAVRRAIDRHGLPFTRSAPQFPQLRDVAWLMDQRARGRTARDVAAEIGCSPSAVTMALARRG
ncbi:hypothetical protein [Actinospongicola halichondriae]|uniref:hypothetical protein n=1 Tax=Actinospongicola halichondriae TaxID=3236844 RepID=UPI003D5C7743